MSKGAYYNEIDKFAAAWLRELIKKGLIADGDVDERSIKDVRGSDLAGYTQIHLFAGIGGWSYGLRLAGWPDDRPVWTGSCPCQPYSAAGRGLGDADPRNLWPEMFRLIGECGPHVVFGEQVESAIGHGWLDGIFSDLEGEDYACGALVLGAHSVGAPHIRQRLYWMANALRARRSPRRAIARERSSSRSGELGWLADPECGATERQRLDMGEAPGRMCGEAREQRLWSDVGNGSDSCGMAYAGHECRGRRAESGEPESTTPSNGGGLGESNNTGPQGAHDHGEPSRRIQCLPSQPSWGNADFLPCRDGKIRRVESGTFPLAHGIPARMGRLRGYGNAIVPKAAAKFIGAFMDVEQDWVAKSGPDSAKV